MGEKKSLFEKFGLVEKVHTSETFASTSEEDESEKPTMPVMAVSHIGTDDPQGLTLASTAKANVVDPIERINNKTILSIEEVYSKYSIKSDGINSMSIVESYLKALPVYLPIDVKRDTTLNIIKSSGVKLENLIVDGNYKLKCLKDFSEYTYQDANEVIALCENEVNNLKQRINTYTKAINNMKKLLEEQDFLINYEVDKLNTIMEFVGSEK